MQKGIQATIHQMFTDKKGRNQTRLIVLTLAMVVLFMVYYFLSSTALTMEREPQCGLEEHSHTEACYDVPILLCPLNEEEVTYICGLENDLNHTHDGVCLGEPHSHGPECWQSTTICGYDYEHSHIEDCYDAELQPSTLDTGDGEPSLEGDSPVPETSSELVNFLKDVKLYDANRNEITDLKVHAGENYIFELKFAENRIGLQFEYNNAKVLTYQLPENLTIAEPQSGIIWKDGIIENGTQLGWYTISKTGEVEVWFMDVDIYGTPIDINFIDKYTDVSFFLEVHATFNVENEETVIDVDFGNDLVVDFTLNDDTALAVNKKDMGYDQTTHIISYKTEITALGGTVKDFHFEDKMTLLWNADNADIAKDNLELVGPIVLTVPGDTPYTISTYTSSIVKVDGEPNTLVTEFDFPEGVTLAAGETAVVTYAVKIKDAAYGYGTNVFKANAKNTVTVSGKDSKENELSKPSSTARTIDKTFFNKSGTGKLIPIDGTSTSAVQWTIQVGDGYVDLAGKTVEDILGPGLAFLTNNSTYNLEITRKSIDKDGTQTTVDTIKGWNLVTIGTTSDGKPNFTYTIPSSPAQKYIYIITFYTTIDAATVPADGVLRNTAKSTIYSSTQLEKEATVINGFIGSGVTKTHTLVGAQNGNDGYIDYTVKIDVPGSMVGRQFYLYDELLLVSSNGSGNLDVYNAPQPQDFKLTVAGTNGQPINGVWYKLVTNNTKGFYVYFGGTPGVDVTKTADSKWQINQDAVITITYRLPLSALLIKPGISIDEVFSDADLYGKSAYLNNKMAAYYQGSGTSGSTRTYKYIYKSGKYDENAKVTNYTVTINANKQYAAAEGPVITEPIFTDKYDSRLEYVPGTFNVAVAGTNAMSSVRAALLTLNGEDLDNYVTIDAANNTLTFDTALISQLFGSTKWYQATGNNLVITYAMKAKEGIDEARFDAHNTASITRYINGEGSTFSSSTDVTYGDKVVTKAMKLAEGNKTADVTIEINKNKAKLGGTTGQITVVDEMSDTLAFYLNSIKVEKYISGEGATEVWEEITLVPNSKDINGYETEGTNKITFYLPDETHLRITYSTLVKGTQGDQVTISNKVTVIGYATYEDEVKNTFIVTGSSAGGGASEHSFTLFKEDAETHARLSGAVFTLYGPRYTGWTDAAAIAAAYDPTITVNGATYYFYQAATTAADGSVLFDHNRLGPGYGYALVEVKAPTGYMLLTEPQLFAIEELPAGADAAMKEIADNITILNKTGYQLPATGGIGTTIFIIVGVVLMLAAVVVLVTRRKISQK